MELHTRIANGHGATKKIVDDFKKVTDSGTFTQQIHNEHEQNVILTPIEQRTIKDELWEEGQFRKKKPEFRKTLTVLPDS